MALRIVEYDFNTKPATRKKANQMRDDTPKKWRAMMNQYWYKVYENCVQAITEMGAVDTGALRDSIRIVQNIAPAGAKFEVTRSHDGDETVYITAGGGGYMNPKNKREVDYASAVHDGYFRTKKFKKQWKLFNLARKGQGLKRLSPASVVGTSSSASGWVPGRPFLDEGLKRTDPYLDVLLTKYMDDKEKTWAEDQPMVNPYSVPLIVTGGK